MPLLAKYFYLINLPPLFNLLLFFILGIIWHSALTLFFIEFLFLLCMGFFSSIRSNTIFRYIILYSFCMLTGSWMHHNEWQSYHDFYNFIHHKKVTATGTVIDINQTIINNRKSNAITLWLDTIATESDARTSNKVIIFYKKNIGNIAVGDTITLKNICCKKPASKDFQQYQIKEQIVATVFDDTVEYTIVNHPVWSLRHWIWQHKQRLLSALENKFSGATFQFFSSLFLGNRSYIKNELQQTTDQFQTWGISHFLARSGLHLVLFIFIWQAIFCIIPLPFFVKQLVITLFSCVYFILTWTSAPFTRSFALFMLNKICWFSKTSFHLLHYLTLVCFLFLLYCPLYLFFLDFQLSFILTFALAWFNQVTFARTEHT